VRFVPILALAVSGLLLGGAGRPALAQTVFATEISGGVGTAGSYTHLYVLFRVVDSADQIATRASVFGATGLTESDLGKVFVSTSATDLDFDPLVALLTNGVDDWLETGTCLGDANGKVACGSSVGRESGFFGRSPDLQGERIESFSIRIDEISIDPGTFTTSNLRATFTISGAAPVPAVPGWAVLALAGLLVIVATLTLGSRRSRQSNSRPESILGE